MMDDIVLPGGFSGFEGVRDAALDPGNYPAGVSLAAAFRPHIGRSLNTVTVTAFSDDAGALDAVRERLLATPGIGGATADRMIPVSERNLPLIAADAALYTNRWFHCRSELEAAFEDDSLMSWDTWEADNGVHAVGLWKAKPVNGVTSYFLIARYASMGAWANSRFTTREGEARPDWAIRFARRRTYLVDTEVITTNCIGRPVG